MLNETVEDKECIMQKYLINSVTSKNTDKIFPERGTDLLKGAIGGAVIDAQAAMHLGNFAALDTLYFCSYEETPSIFDSDMYVNNFDLKPADYDGTTNTLSFFADFYFKDGTTAVASSSASLTVS